MFLFIAAVTVAAVMAAVSSCFAANCCSITDLLLLKMLNSVSTAAETARIIEYFAAQLPLFHIGGSLYS